MYFEPVNRKPLIRYIEAFFIGGEDIDDLFRFEDGTHRKIRAYFYPLCAIGHKTVQRDKKRSTPNRSYTVYSYIYFISFSRMNFMLGRFVSTCEKNSNIWKINLAVKILALVGASLIQIFQKLSYLVERDGRSKFKAKNYWWAHFRGKSPNVGNWPKIRSATHFSALAGPNRFRIYIYIYVA